MIPNTVTSIQYAGNGSANVFSFGNKIFAATDLIVSLINNATGAVAVQPYPATYSVQNADVDTGCQVTMVTPPPVGYNLDIRTITSMVQSTSIKNQGSFLPELHEEAFDRVTRELQDLLRRTYTYAIHGPDNETVAWPALPGPAGRKGFNLIFDAVTGLPALGLPSTVTYTQATLGALFYPQNAAESLAGVLPPNMWYYYGDVRRYGAIADGVTDNAVAFQNAALCNAQCTVSPGTWMVTSAAITADNVSFRGEGWTTILKVGANNSRIFNVTGQGFHCSSMQWQGDLTSNNSTNGVGAYLNGAGGAVFEDVYSTGFGFGAISGVASSALAAPKIYRHKCRLTGAGGTEFYLGGLWVGTVVEDADCYSTTADRALLVFDNGTTGWTGVTVTRGGARGYLKQQWAVTDENWDGTLRVWDVIFDGVYCVQSNWSAIKCKTSQNVKIVNCSFDRCGLAQEDQPNGLYGDVLCNSLGKVEILNNTFRQSGSTAIRVQSPLVSQYPGANPNGQANDSWRISGNLIDTTGVVFAQADGIIIVNGVKGVLIDHNIMRGITRYGLNAVCTATSPFWDLGVYDNTITDSPAMAQAFNVAFGQSYRSNGNFVQNSGANGTVITDVQYVDIGPGDTFLDPALGAGRGYQIGNCLDLNFRARVGNSTYPAWVALTLTTVGTIRFNGANVYECVVGGTTGNTGGPTGTAPGVTEGTVTWAYVGKYQLCAYGVRLVGTQGKVNLDFDPAGCTTGPIETLVTGPGGTRVHYTTSIATTNATVTSAQVIPITDLTAWYCEMKVLAQDSTTPNRAAFGQAGLFYRAGGVTTREGALSPLFTTIASAGAAAWLAVPAASGNNLAPAQVTGAAAKNINWQCEITMLGMP